MRAKSSSCTRASSTRSSCACSARSGSTAAGRAPRAPTSTTPRGALSRLARRLRDVQRRAEQPAGAGGAGRGARARDAGEAGLSASRRWARSSPMSCSSARRRARSRPVHELGHRGGGGGDQDRPRGDGPLAGRLGRARLPRADARLALASGDPAFSDRFEPLLPGFSRVPFNDLDALEAELRREDVALFIVEPVLGHGVYLPAPRIPRGRTGAVPALRDALLRRRGADGLRPNRQLFALEHWGLEPDMSSWRSPSPAATSRWGRRFSLRDVFDAVFDSLEHSISHGSTFEPNDLSTVAGLRRCTNSSRRPRRALGPPGRVAARAHEAACRALRGRQGRARARPHVGDRVRRAGEGPDDLPPARADAAGALRAARRRPALHRTPHPQPGRGSPPERRQGPAAAVLSEEDVDWFATALDATSPRRRSCRRR